MTTNQQPPSHAVTVFWLVWFFGSVAVFMGMEFTMLAKGRPQDTLSAQVWRLKKLLPGQDLWQWTALHVLLGGALFVLLGWLLLHFVFGIWT